MENWGLSICLWVLPDLQLNPGRFDHAAALLNRIMNGHVSQPGKRLPTVYAPFRTATDPPAINDPDTRGRPSHLHIYKSLPILLLDPHAKASLGKRGDVQ
jgi:hypothetical protein